MENELSIYHQLSELYRKSQEYKDSDNLKALYTYMAAFPKIAVFNLMLVQIQRPGARFVASEYDWKRRYGRQVRQGARPMLILVPFGPVLMVYDVSDTEGKPLPPEIEHPFELRRETFNPANLACIFEALEKSLPMVGVELEWVDYGSQQGGAISLKNPPGIFKKGKYKERFYEQPFRMELGRRLGISAALGTLVHELGHLLCGHLMSVGSIPVRSSDLSCNTMEFEAESVCWLFFKRCGVDYEPAVSYLHGYLNGGQEIPEIDIGAILYAVNYIEGLSRGAKSFFKELECGPYGERQ